MSKIGRAQMEQFMAEERQRKDSRATRLDGTGQPRKTEPQRSPSHNSFTPVAAMPV